MAAVFDLYVLDKDDKKLDLICAPFYLSVDSFKDYYEKKIEEYAGYQYQHRIETKEFVKVEYDLTGRNIIYDEWQEVRDYFNREDQEFRLFYRHHIEDKLYYSHISYEFLEDFPKGRGQKILTNLRLIRKGNWILEKPLYANDGDGEELSLGYDYVYNDDADDHVLVYGRRTYDSSFFPMFQENLGDETAPFRIEKQGYFSNIEWYVQQNGVILASGKINGSFNGLLVIDTSKKEQQITLNGVDIRQMRDYEQTTWFNIPRGRSVIVTKGIGALDSRSVMYEQYRII